MVVVVPGQVADEVLDGQAAAARMHAAAMPLLGRQRGEMSDRPLAQATERGERFGGIVAEILSVPGPTPPATHHVDRCYDHPAMLSRRQFLGTLSAGVLATPDVTEAQQSPKVYQIGYLSVGSPAEAAKRVNALRIGLQDQGAVEGKNINLVFRWAETAERLPELAADLAHLKVDLIFAPTSTEVEAARQATKTIPIVFAGHADPVAVGHVASLARPGGNITGLSMLLPEIVPKQLEIMKQALPHMKRIGMLAVSTAPSTTPALRAAEATAHRLGIQVLPLLVRRPEDFDGAFTTMARDRVNGFLAVPCLCFAPSAPWSSSSRSSTVWRGCSGPRTMSRQAVS